MLGMGKDTVEIILAARDRTAAAFAKVNTRMKTMGGATGQLKSSMGGLTGKMSSLAASMNPVAIAVGAAGIALVTLGGAAIKASLDFEKAFATIRIGTGATGDALKGLNDDFRAIYGTIPSTAAEISGALTAMNTTTGASGTALQDLTKNIMNTSRMLGEDGTGNAQAFGEAMQQWQIPVESGVALMEQFFSITQTTGIGFGELTGAMNAYGPVLQNAGFTAAQSAELFGRLEGSGIAVSRVMPGLNSAFRKWAEEGKNGKVALEGTIGAILNAETQMKALTIATDAFGAEGAQRMTTAVRNGTFELSSLGKMLEGTEGIIMKTSEATLKFGDKWTLLKNQVTAAIAPIGDVILNVLGGGIKVLSAAFGALQKVVSVNIKTMLIPIKALQALFEGLFAPILAALAPLKGSFDGISGSASKLNIIFKVFSDVVTIITGVAKMLGTAIGNLVAMALTPLVAKLQEGIQMLSNFYDKLGPVKNLIEGVKGVAGGVVEGISNMADSFKETVPPIEEVEEALKNLGEEGPKAPKAVADAWALAIKSFQEGTGSYKEAIGGIEEKIAALTEEYMTATDKRKTAIEKEVELLKSEKDTLEELKRTAEDALSSTAKETEEATQKMEEFKVTIGDTTIEFKGAAAEVVKNADAYEKLQDSAQKIMDLDWSVFTEFEDSLPNIEVGIRDMESSFVGLKGILDDNIVSLENVQESVMGISEIAAPFLEAGFLKGIESIGSFAGTLKAAGSAINDFSSLQDVSIDGCINFSTHVRDMVSALELLEGQMEDLVPDFAKMDSLITDIADAFLYGAGKSEVFESSFENMINNAYTLAEKGGMAFTEFSDIIDDAVSNEKINHIERFWQVVDSNTATSVQESLASMRAWTKGISGVGISFQEYYDLLNMSSEEQGKWLYDFLHTNKAITFQMDKQTNALKDQTGQLSKITEALQPYLEFMRTLNELAALSTLSTAELNSGLNSINDTLINLGEALSTFDLRPVMESLFGTKIAPGEFTGGITTAFIDTMFEYASEFSTLIGYVERLSNSVLTLVSSFEALSNISESVLADQDKLKGVLEGMTDALSNFNLAMGGGEGEWGFAQKIADGIDSMLKSATPLVLYFQKNNAAIELFNTTLKTLTSIIKTVTDAMDMLKRMSEMVLPEITELERGFNNTGESISRFTEAVSTSFAGVKIDLEDLNTEWVKHEEGIDQLIESFGQATDTVSTLAAKIVSLTGALKELRDMTVLSMYDIDRAMKKIPDFLGNFVKALALNMYDIVESLKALDTEWVKYADDMKDTMPAFESSTDNIGKLVGSLLSLNSALKELAEMGTISGAEFDRGFSALMESISNFAGSLSKNVDGLIISLQTLRDVWMANEAVLFPLIRDFAIISDNLYGVAHNANRMTEEFKALSENTETLEEGFKNLIGFIDQVVKSTKEFYTPEAAAELAGYTKDVGKVIAAFVDLEIGLKGAMDKIRTAIGNAVDAIEGKIKSISTLTATMYNSGANLMQSLINGIWSKTSALIQAVAWQAAVIKAYLGVSSNAELGPLSHLTDWGPNLVKTYADGIKSEMHTLDASFASMAPSMGAGTAMVGGTNNVNLYVTQNIGSQADADYANQGLTRLLQRHSVM